MNADDTIARALDEFFSGRLEARAIFEALVAEFEALGPTSVRVSKSQVVFRRKRNAAVIWTPDRYLGKGAPLVLTVSFRYRDPSPRWKEITPVAGGRFTHHLELRSPQEIDDEVREWICAAWKTAE